MNQPHAQTSEGMKDTIWAASTQLTCQPISKQATEDHAARFAAYGWHTQSVEDGNDLEAIDRALCAARQETGRPSFDPGADPPWLRVPPQAGYLRRPRLTPGRGRGDLDETEPGLAVEPPFLIPAEVEGHFRQALDLGRKTEADWDSVLDLYEAQFPELGRELRAAHERRVAAGLGFGHSAILPLIPKAWRPAWLREDAPGP